MSGWVRNSPGESMPVAKPADEWEFHWTLRSDKPGGPHRVGLAPALGRWQEVATFRWVPIEVLARSHTGSKYLRRINVDEAGRADVYDVLEAFNVTCPARAHAIKKLLCAGIRGKGNALQDLKETADAVARAITLEGLRK
jgi:hypothetical protein